MYLLVSTLKIRLYELQMNGCPQTSSRWGTKSNPSSWRIWHSTTSRPTPGSARNWLRSNPSRNHSCWLWVACHQCHCCPRLHRIPGWPGPPIWGAFWGQRSSTGNCLGCQDVEVWLVDRLVSSLCRNRRCSAALMNWHCNTPWNLNNSTQVIWQIHLFPRKCQKYVWNLNRQSRLGNFVIFERQR